MKFAVAKVDHKLGIVERFPRGIEISFQVISYGLGPQNVLLEDFGLLLPALQVVFGLLDDSPNVDLVRLALDFLGVLEK